MAIRFSFRLRIGRRAAWLETEYARLVRSRDSRSLDLPVRHVSYESAATAGKGTEPAMLRPRRTASREAASQPLESEIHVRFLCGGRVQPVRARRRAIGGHQPFAQLQSAVYLWRRGHGQDPPDACHRPRADGQSRVHAHHLHLQRALHERDDLLHPHWTACRISTIATARRMSC